MTIDRDYFTLIFQGDIGKFKDNPLMAEMIPYGRPVASGRGHAFNEADVLLDALERIESVCQRAFSWNDSEARQEILRIAQSILIDVQ